MLVSVCPTQSDRYDVLNGMLAPHTAGLLDLHRRGMVVSGQRRAARTFVVGVCLGVCDALGHNGPNTSRPCPICLGKMAPIQRLHALDMAFGSIRDVSRRSPPRHAADLIEMQCTLRAGGRVASQVGLATHVSIERPPLLFTDPQQIVPMPENLGSGISRRILGLAVEAVIVQECCSTTGPRVDGDHRGCAGGAGGRGGRRGTRRPPGDDDAGGGGWQRGGDAGVGTTGPPRCSARATGGAYPLRRA